MRATEAGRLENHKMLAKQALERIAENNSDILDAEDREEVLRKLDEIVKTVKATSAKLANPRLRRDFGDAVSHNLYAIYLGVPESSFEDLRSFVQAFAKIRERTGCSGSYYQSARNILRYFFPREAYREEEAPSEFEEYKHAMR